jgi:hypothetical protein
MTDKEVLIKYPLIYQHLLETVKPERDENRDPARRKNWWLFARSNEQMRNAIKGLSRYIATVQTSKHCLFYLLEGDILPDDKLIAIGLDDAYYLGVLASRTHVTWALATGGRMGVGNDPVYDKTRCFDPFPFPDASLTQQTLIRELAEALDAHRKRQQAEHPSLTLTSLYNVVEKLRASQSLTPKEQTIKQQGLAMAVLELHHELDAAVASAYGWPADLSAADLLTRLVALNRARAAEEKTDIVRYLRPAYQAPGQQQTSFKLATRVNTEAATIVTPLLWPAQLAEQIQAVRDVVAQATTPLTSKQVAARFRGVRARRVQPLLMTLATLSLLRWVDATDAYTA